MTVSGFVEFETSRFGDGQIVLLLIDTDAHPKLVEPSTRQIFSSRQVVLEVLPVEYAVLNAIIASVTPELLNRCIRDI